MCSLRKWGISKAFFSFDLCLIKKNIGQSLANIGKLYTEMGDFSKGTEYLTRSLVIREKLGDTYGIGSVLGTLGVFHQTKGNYVKALDYHNRSLTICESLSAKRGIAIQLMNIGGIYNIKGEYAKSVEYLEKSLSIFKEIELNERDMILINTANLYLSY